MSTRLDAPPISHNENYSKTGRLVRALSHYHAELENHIQTPENTPKPVMFQFARIYDISETTLRRHIKNPLQKTHHEVNQESQLLTPDEEKAPVERLMSLDDFNIPASKSQLYDLAYQLLHKRKPGTTIGVHWIYRFLARPDQCRYSIVKVIVTNRANAITWDMMDDSFAKVYESQSYHNQAINIQIWTCGTWL